LQALLPEHTFFALVAALLVIVFGLRARSALARAEDPTVPEAKLGASMCLILRVFSFSFFLAI